ncbi:three-helix bundle dimerization domain-containing protein [Nocardioides iriomotensis]|uniref:DUF3562 domain-containing protein n=1 Tax=Nocardioides iriomotensis TaxID=715784 RepID=A0A4Q5JA17_9ACTN|nr:hypothetical protein [Nocardioides iriomotensis]RYU14779.1 hypothetical protein ETU37_01970 [Nocardioides iriomotensis]
MTLASQVAPDEETRVADVRARLRERFPDLDEDLITRAVDEAHRALDGASVRDFVPILVEKRARDVLLEHSRQ